MATMTVEKMTKAIAGTQFEKDLGNALAINSAQSSRGWWNLICSIRDCKLYSKGIKAHRNWRISDVKWYFGVKGGAEAIAQTLEQYRDVLASKEGKEALK